MELEGSTGSGGHNDGSPISSVAPDHLFTILLLLPIDSILSFSITCSKFRALASSDTLWEAICRREWGSTSVDALKSYHLSQLPWMRVFKQLSHLDSVYCHRLSHPDAQSSLPSPRASHSLNFVSDCLVLFGGGCEGGLCSPHFVLFRFHPLQLLSLRFQVAIELFCCITTCPIFLC